MLRVPELAHLLQVEVPGHVQDAVALSVLSGANRAEIEVMGHSMEFVWDGQGLTVDRGLGGLEIKLAESGDSLGEWDACKRRELHAVGLLVMRCIPTFKEHPVLRLVPKRTYAMPASLLPDYYVQRFESDPTQLDGNVLFKYHQRRSSWFQLPHSSPAFEVSWSVLWSALRTGQMV